MGEKPSAMSPAALGFTLGVLSALASIIVGPKVGTPLVMVAAVIHWAFRMRISAKNALVVMGATILWIFGFSYFLHVRRDAVGFAIMIACGSIAFATIRPIRRAIQNPSSK